MLKPLIVVLLIGVLLSLFSGLVFLFQDSDRQNSKRTLYALGVRISLASALLATLFYGFYTGQLRIGTKAPWHNRVPVSESATPDGAADPQRLVNLRAPR